MKTTDRKRTAIPLIWALVVLFLGLAGRTTEAGQAAGPALSVPLPVPGSVRFLAQEAPPMPSVHGRRLAAVSRSLPPLRPIDVDAFLGARHADPTLRSA